MKVQAGQSDGLDQILVADYVWALDPTVPMAGRLNDGGTILASTAPGCWGPMITPDFPSTHEVTRPVYVVGTEPGDSLAISIDNIELLSSATTSGTHVVTGTTGPHDPGISPQCSGCGVRNPATYLSTDSRTEIRCKFCDAKVSPYRIGSGYTMLLDNKANVGVTVSATVAELIRRRASETMALPINSRQYSANLLAVGNPFQTATRIIPMIGNLGTIPNVRVPSSRNVGDLAWALTGNDEPFGLHPNQLPKLTDSHLDSSLLRVGATLVVPVRVPGAGVFLGDVHAMQGDGELAGHTTDVSAVVAVSVKIIKGLDIPGPLLLPAIHDLQPLATPLTPQEWRAAERLATANAIHLDDSIYPIEMFGTGRDLNSAIESAIQRLSALLEMSVDEVRNRATYAGGARIARLPGVASVGLRISGAVARKRGLHQLLIQKYGSFLPYANSEFNSSLPRRALQTRGGRPKKSIGP